VKLLEKRRGVGRSAAADTSLGWYFAVTRISLDGTGSVPFSTC
jgi:hypothetical protein